MRQSRSIPIDDSDGATSQHSGIVAPSDKMSQDDNGVETDTPSPQTTAESQAEPPPRQARADRPDAFHFSAWLLEGLSQCSMRLCSKEAQKLRHNDLGLPQAFWTHAHAARREALFAARVLLDAALACCETHHSERDEKDHKQRGRVDIDFS